MRSVRAAIATPRWLGALLGTVVLAGALTGAIRLMEFNSRSGKDVADAKLAMSRLPLIFEANRGQTDGQVKFLSRGAGYNFYITPTASYLALARLPESAKQGQKAQKLPEGAPVSRLKMSLVGGNPKANIRHDGDQLGLSNYFIGNKPENWVTDVPSFGRVLCEDVWKGVDLVYYGNQQELEHDFILDPGVSPKTVRLEYEGQKELRVDESGELVLNTGLGEVRQKAPIAYQVVKGERKPVEAEYQLLADNQVGFKVGPYDESQQLVIDPVIRYSTYIGGSADDYAFDVQVDASRNAYITGYTGSFFQDANNEPSRDPVSVLTEWPLVNQFQGDPDRINNSSRSNFNTTENPDNNFTYFDESSYDAFVTKFNATGTSPLLYSTYLGAENDDYGLALTTSPSSSVDHPFIYVTGCTESIYWPLQVAVQNQQGGRDGFAVKLDTSRSGASQLVFSTYLGGSGNDIGRAIAVDGTQNVHIAGITNSTNLPVFSTDGQPFQSTLAGSSDIFLVSLDASGSAFNYYTYFGGSGSESGLPVTAPINFNYIVPRAPYSSPGTQTWNGRAFATPYGDDQAVAIAVDDQGNTFVAGGTASLDLFASFPPGAQNGPQPAHAPDTGRMDGFVAKFDTAGRPVYGTYLGGGGDDACRSIAINPQGEAYVTGYTASGDFPTVAPTAASIPAYTASFQGGASDAFVAKLNTSGNEWIYSTYLGGNGTDVGNDIAVSPSGQAYVCGTTTSSFPSFPLVNPSQNDLRGGVDCFLAKLRPNGAEFEYSTYFGGSAGWSGPPDDLALGIDVDSNGQAYIAGTTASLDLPTSFFTYRNGQQGPLNGRYELMPVADVFVAQHHSPPFAPSNLITTAIGNNGGNHFISLAWTDNSDNEGGFEVERKLGDQSSASPWQVVATINTANTVTHTNSGLVATTTYTYRVRPFNRAVVANVNTTFYGPYSNQLTVTTLPEPPAAPTNLVVTPIDTQRLKLDWNDASNNEASFIIERRRITTPATSFMQIANILSDATNGPGTGARTFTDDNAGAGLAPNTTYEYQIRANNAAGDSAILGPVQGTTLPTAPTVQPVFNAPTATNSQVNLTWTYNAQDQVGFKLYRATAPGGPFNLIRTDTQGPDLTDTTAPFDKVYSFTDGGRAANTTYYYQVRAYNQSGDGPLSSTVSATTLPNPPQDASDLSVTLTPPDAANLEWTDNSTDETGFKIEQALAAGGPWTLTTTYTSQPAEVPATGLRTTTINGLQRNTVFYFRVIAFANNGVGDSDAQPSNTDCVLTQAVNASNLDAATTSQTVIDLTWDDNNPAGTTSNFRIERSPDGSSNWTFVANDGNTPAGGQKSFQVTGLTPNTQYFFRVRAFNTAPAGCDGGGDSPANSNVDSAWTLPSVPQALLITNIAPTTNLRIAFTDANAPGSTSAHRVERSTDQSTWTLVATLPAGTTTVDDNNGGTNLNGNRTYFYRVMATNPGGNSAAITGNRLTLPAAATNLLATVPTTGNPRRGRTEIDLTWTDNSFAPTQFRVERSPDGMSGWTQIGTAQAGVNAYTDTGLTENTQYCYRVIGTNGSGNGDVSNTQCATTLKVPPTGPEGLTATVISSSQINLAWTDTANNEEGFRIERKIGINGTFAPLAGATSLPVNSNSYQDTGLTENTTYTYRVYAFNNGGDSAPSREAGGTTLQTPPAAPSNLDANATSASVVRLTWTDNASNETGFEVEVTPQGGTASTRTVNQVSAGTGQTVTFDATGLNPNTSYVFRVRARNNNVSAWVGPASDLTFPANPSGLTASLQTNPRRVELAWTDNNGANPSGNRIMRKEGSNSFLILTDRAAASGTTYTDDTVMAGKTYTYVIVAINTNGDLSTGSTNEATVVVPPDAPQAPETLTATAQSTTSILLAWTDKSDNETLFKIERSTDGVTFRQVATKGTAPGADTQVTHTDQGLVSNTLYIYRVRAANGGGDSAYSNTAQATTLPNPPGAPSGLTATAQSQTEIWLSWSDSSSNEDEFVIFRRNDMGAFVEHDTVAANSTSYSDSGLTANTAYSYQVRARNGGGSSNPSNTATATTHPNAPAAPSLFTATGQSQNSIRLTWQDNSTDETSFKLERSQNQTTWISLATLGANTTSYLDNGLNVDTIYYYRLVASNIGGDSTAVSTSGRTHPNPPSAPSSLTAVATGQTSVLLTWQDNSDNESSFRIERRLASGGTFSLAGTVGADLEQFTDTSGLIANTGYVYRVQAANDGGVSSFSNEANVTTLPNPPAAPSNLLVTVPTNGSVAAAAAGSTSLVLTWQDNSNNEDGFEIYRRTAGENFGAQPNATVGTNITTYTDQNLSPQTTYFYVVVATNAGGDSAATAEASGTTLPNPPGTSPTGLQATAVSSSSIRLNWTDAVTGETGFTIERKPEGGNFQTVGSAPANATEHFDNGLAASTTYYYRVRAKNTGGDGPASNEANATTLTDLPSTPAGVTVSTPAAPAGRTQLVVTWSDSQRESSYVIQRRTAQGAFTQAGSVGEGVTTFTDTNLVPGTTYIYRVIARNPTGDSSPSGEAQGETLPNPPAAPSNVTVLVAGSDILRVEWQDNSNDETGFRVERKIGENQFAVVNTTGANVTSTKVGGLETSAVQTFRVIAFNAGGDSSPSNEASGVTPGSGRLKVSRTKVNFANVLVGGSATRTVRLTNIGTTPLMVAYTPVEAPFNVEAPQAVSILLQPKDFVEVTVSFTPAARGRARSTLRITSTDPRRSRANVQLLGNGTVPRKGRR